MGLAIWIQILDETVFISLDTNAFGKDMDLSVLDK